MTDNAFAPARERLAAKFKASNADFYRHTLPQDSTVYFRGTVHPVESAIPAAIVVFLPQTREPFGYGRKDLVPGLNLPATEADTTLTTAHRTPLNFDIAIDGFQAHCVQTLPIMAKLPEADEGEPFGPADVFGPTLLRQNAVWRDPGALMSPPQCDSPINLENAIFEALRTSIVCSIRFDGGAAVNLGTLDRFPSGPNSYLRASGTPEYQHKYQITEGFIWHAADTDSQLHMEAKLVRPVHMPIHLAELHGPGGRKIPMKPQEIAVGVKFVAHGLAFRFLSINA